MRRYLGGRNVRADFPVAEDEAAQSLGRLTAAIERLVTDLDNVPEYTSDTSEAVRKLRIWRADYLRRTAELDAAARSLTLLEQRLGRRIEAALADWERRFEVAAAGAAQHRPPATRQGWWRGSRRRRGAEGLATAPEDAVQERWEFDSDATLGSGWAPPPDTYDADIAARVLGPMELSVGGGRILKWSSLKARAIFQYLLIHQGRPVRREVLMELEWPDHSHNSARNNLNVALYSLRNTLDKKGLPARTVVHKEGCYLLNPSLTCWIDRNEFHSLIGDARRARREGSTQQAVDACRTAVQLYRGPLFEDDPSGEWYLPERRQLKELNLQAVEYLAQTYYDRDQLSMAVECGQHAISIDPCYEAAHRLLMRCYARQHQQQLVSRQYNLCVAALRDELEVSPDAETIRLLHSLTSTA